MIISVTAFPAISALAMWIASSVRTQRMFWASTGTKDPKAADVLYVTALAAPHSVNSMPERTLHALADHDEIGPMLPQDGGDVEQFSISSQGPASTSMHSRLLGGDISVGSEPAKGAVFTLWLPLAEADTTTVQD